ncbi:MAG: creatininase family protein [Phycisphaerales bacterium]
MTPRPYVLAETNWKTVSETRYEVAVLPWGATEVHNFHLPYGTDTMQVEAVAREAARIAWEAGARVVVLPAVAFGVQTGQLDIPLCINMNPSTQLAVLRDVADSLAGQGIKKLVILNGHGGNDFRAMIRELTPRTPVMLCAINWYQVEDGKLYFAAPGDHAGELETSVMQHVAPGLVRPLSEAGDGSERKLRMAGFREGWAWTPRRWRSASADTGIGDPRAASAEKGERFVAAVGLKVGAFLAEFARADPSDMYER